MCAHRQNACKHGCLQALLPYFLFWTFLLLHQLTSRCEDRLGSLAPAVIFIAVRNKAISFHPLLNYFTLFDPLSLIYVPQTHYAEGDCIIRQGATGDTFYIISKGQVKCYALCSLHRWNEAFSKKRLWRTKCQRSFGECTMMVIIDFGAFMHCFPKFFFLFWSGRLKWQKRSQVKKSKQSSLSSLRDSGLEKKLCGGK